MDSNAWANNAVAAALILLSATGRRDAEVRHSLLSIISGGKVMLVLTRKSGQEIRIGADIVVSVIRTRGRRVRLGIAAPRSIAIRRQELVMEASSTMFGKRSSLT
jgi:carbon storage regulator CsrA